MILLVLLIIFLFAMNYFLREPLKYWIKKGVKQKKMWHCFSVSWLKIFKPRSIVFNVKDYYDEFPNRRYNGCYLFNKPMLTIRDPELINRITVKDFEFFMDRRTYIPEDIDPLFGQNLGALKGEKWRNMRCTLSPAFTSSKMKAMFFLIKECSENFVNYFLKQDQDHVPCQFKDISARFCTNLIATVAFGVSVNCLENQNNDFYLRGKGVTDLTKFSKLLKLVGYNIAPAFYRILNIKFSSKDEDTFFRNLIDKTIEKRKQKGIFRPDMLQLLMQISQGVNIEEENSVDDTGFAIVKEPKSEKGSRLTNITNEDITAQAFVFFFAGFESVSTLICFTAYELAVNQDIQEKLRNEIYETNEKCKGKLSYEALVQMKYLDMIIAEVLRKWPAQAAAKRICTKPYLLQPSNPEESPVDIEPDTVILIPTFGIHRDPKYYPDPERFDPERFSEKNKANIHPYSYIPFGVGPRSCIGSRLALLEVKILFFYVLANFEIVPVEKTRIPIELTKTPALLSIEEGCWLGLKRIII